MKENRQGLEYLINRLWEIYERDKKIDSVEIIEQIFYMLLIKQTDREPLSREIEGEILWKNFSKMPSEELHKHLCEFVFPVILDYYGKKSESFSKGFTDAVLKIPAQDLREIVKYIDALYALFQEDLFKKEYSDVDIDGIICETLLNKTVFLGNRGQFRTPRHIVNLMTALVKPEEGQKIVDPACGTGGFLLSAYRAVKTDMLAEKGKDKEIETDIDGFKFASYAAMADDVDRIDLCGMDNNNAMVRLSILNLMMHGIENPSIGLKDSVDDQIKYDPDVEQYDIVLTNPPSGNNVEKNLGKKETRRAPLEVLFLETVPRLLKSGGRAAVVIPEGILTNSGAAYRRIRKNLLEETKLDAVVSLPSGVFRPYTHGKSAILVFTKIDPSDKNKQDDHQIWFYELKNDGYTLDDKRERLKDYPLIELKEKFENRYSNNSDRTTGFFFVPSKEIKESNFDLSFNRYRKHTFVEQQFGKPEELLKEIMNNEEDMLRNLIEFEKTIKWK